MFIDFTDGLLQALSWWNLTWCLLGTLLGTAIGIIPGLGPLAAISLLLPLVLQMNDSVAAMIMLAGIYYGSQYGGSTTSILLNMPGESASVVTVQDGYAMTQQGRAHVALFFAAVGSFIAGCVATVLIGILGKSMSEFGLRFASQEIAALMFLGLVGAVIMFPGNAMKNLSMVILGLLLSLIGTDINSGINRFDFGWVYLANGIEIGVMAMGMFGLAEIVRSLSRSCTVSATTSYCAHPISRQDWRDALPAITRGSILGSILGVIPGGGAILASYVSYATEKKVAAPGTAMGHGAIQGVAGPESANNAGAQTSMIPMLTLGVPPNPVIALMLAAMIAHGIQPGPQIMIDHSNLFWTLVASMLIGNVMLLILNLPLIGIWIRLLRLPMSHVYPILLAIMCIGAYSIKNSVWDVMMLIPFALLGLWLTNWKCNITVVIMAFVLGQSLEENLRRSLVISHGDWNTFIDRPLTLTILAIAVVLLLWPLVRWVSNKLVPTNIRLTNKV